MFCKEVRCTAVVYNLVMSVRFHKNIFHVLNFMLYRASVWFSSDVQQSSSALFVMQYKCRSLLVVRERFQFIPVNSLFLSHFLRSHKFDSVSVTHRHAFLCAVKLELCNLILANLVKVSNYSYCFQQVEFFQQSFDEECGCGLMKQKLESKPFSCQSQTLE